MTRTIRAKFSCTSVLKDHYGNETVNFDAVYGNDGDNAEWSKATPSGSLEMMISNPEAQGFFEPSKDYYLDISAVDTSKTPNPVK